RVVARAVIEQDHPGPARNEPPAEVAVHSAVTELLERLADRAVSRLLLEFDRRGVGVVGPDEAVAVAPAVYHGGGLGTQDGVNPAQLPADLPGTFDQKRRLLKGLGPGAFASLVWVQLARGLGGRGLGLAVIS